MVVPVMQGETLKRHLSATQNACSGPLLWTDNNILQIHDRKRKWKRRSKAPFLFPYTHRTQQAELRRRTMGGGGGRGESVIKRTPVLSRPPASTLLASFLSQRSLTPSKAKGFSLPHCSLSLHRHGTKTKKGFFFCFFTSRATTGFR